MHSTFAYHRLNIISPSHFTITPCYLRNVFTNYAHFSIFIQKRSLQNMPIYNRSTQYIILQKVQCICMYILCTIKPTLGHACLVSIATQVNLHLPYGRVRIGSSDHLVVSVSYTSILEKKEFSPLCPLNT